MKKKNPKLPELTVRAILEANGCNRNHLSVLAIRGYYLDSMGQPGKNDRRIYDDAHFVCWPAGMAAFVGNTDPNGYRAGSGKGAGKGMAMLAEGIHRYGTGRHKGRLAFRQAEPFTVIRDGNPPYKDVGFHAINWHSGGNVSTSSLGCQTNPPAEWEILRPLVYRLLEQCKNPKAKNDWGQSVRTFDYVLLHEENRREGKHIVSTRYL